MRLKAASTNKQTRHICGLFFKFRLDQLASMRKNISHYILGEAFSGLEWDRSVYTDYNSCCFEVHEPKTYHYRANVRGCDSVLQFSVVDLRQDLMYFQSTTDIYIWHGCFGITTGYTSLLCNIPNVPPLTASLRWHKPKQEAYLWLCSIPNLRYVIICCFFSFIYGHKCLTELLIYFEELL